MRDWPRTLSVTTGLGLIAAPVGAYLALSAGHAAHLYPIGYPYAVPTRDLARVLLGSMLPAGTPGLILRGLQVVHPSRSAEWVGLYARWMPWVTGAGAVLGAAGAGAIGWLAGDMQQPRPERGRWLMTGRAAMRAAKRAMLRECQLAGGAGARIHPSIPISLIRELESVLYIGGQGSGKTTVMEWMITSILREEPHARLVIHDPKRDYTSRILSQPEASGHTLLHALWDKRTAIWAVSEDIDSEIAAQELASRLVPPADGRNAIFANGAAAMLTGLLISLQRKKIDEGMDWGWAELREAIIQPYPDMRAMALAGNPEADMAENPATNPTASFLSNLKTEVAPLLRGLAMAEREARGRKNYKTWSARAWIRGECGPRVVVLQGSGTYGRLAEAVNGAIIQAMTTEVSELEDSRSRRIWMLLDEFGQLGKIEGVEKFLEIGRSKGICSFFATQSTKHFSKYEKVNLPGLFSTVILGKCRDEDADWAADYIGRQTVTRHARSHSGRAPGLAPSINPSSVTVGEQQSEPYVVYPSEFSGLGFKRRWLRKGIEALLVTGPDHVYRLWWPISVWENVAPGRVPANWTRSLKKPPQQKHESTATSKAATPRAAVTTNVAAQPVPVIRAKPEKSLQQMPAPQRLAGSAASPDPDDPFAFDPSATATESESPTEAIADEIAKAALDAVIPGASLMADLAELVDDSTVAQPTTTTTTPQQPTQQPAQPRRRKFRRRQASEQQTNEDTQC